MTTWLGPGDVIDAQLSSGGPAGITKGELKNIEKHSARVTTSDDDPPLHVIYRRDLTSKKATFELTRFSKSQNAFDPILRLSGNIGDDFLNVGLYQGNSAIIEPASAVFEHLKDKRAELAQRIVNKDLSLPNRLLMRSVFTTSENDVYWMQLTSPVAPSLNQELLYRIYVHPQLASSAKEHSSIVAALVNDARSYQKPLAFKFIYAGIGDAAQRYLVDPNNSKIVYWFTEKAPALELGNHLENLFKTDPSLQAIKPESMTRRYVAQKIWGHGMILLGKGMKEERQAIIEDLNKNPTSEIIRKAERYSVLRNPNP